MGVERYQEATGTRVPASGVGQICRTFCTLLLCGATALPLNQAQAETLRQALASAYQYNPRLDAERARLRATDEEVPRAKAGFRPQISASADAGRQKLETSPAYTGDGATKPWGYALNLSQPVFTGFRTVNAVSEAEASVRAGREQLRDVEQQILLEAVTAFADVVRDNAIVKLREHNVQVLTKQLNAAEERRAVREVTRTDVAQAKARRARAVSQLDQARASLKASRAAFEKVTGHAAGSLSPPAPPTKLLPKTLEEAVSIGEKESPAVVGAQYREQASRFTVDRIRGELLPDVRIEASYSNRTNPSTFFNEQETATVLGRVTVPLYEGGETYARVRQAKHTNVSRLQEIEQARSEVTAKVTQAWSQFSATKTRLKSDQIQVDANAVALEGVREEEKVGQRTLLDVLNAEQELLDAQVQLVSTRHDLVVAAYTLVGQIGRLGAAEMQLAENVYDPTSHYEEVHSKWFGLDITRSDGRKERVDVAVSSDPDWVIDE